MSTIPQLAGAALVLAAFWLTQRRVLAPDARSVLLLNAVGAGTLALVALHGEEWGFLLLEGVWSAVAVAGLVRTCGDRRSRSTTVGRITEEVS